MHRTSLRESPHKSSSRIEFTSLCGFEDGPEAKVPGHRPGGIGKAGPIFKSGVPARAGRRGSIPVRFRYSAWGRRP